MQAILVAAILTASLKSLEARSLINENAARSLGVIHPRQCAVKAVRQLYENAPYPPRNVAAEIPGEILHPTHDDVAIIRNVCFDGYPLPGESNFRALIAGGGTGDATISLALSFAKERMDIFGRNCPFRLIS